MTPTLRTASLAPEKATPLRVLVSNLPRLLYDVLAPRIQQARDMVLVGEVQGPVETLLAAMQGADVLVLGAPTVRPAPGLCTQLFGELPHLRIVVLSFNGDASQVYWLGMRGRKVRRVSSDSVVSAIRSSRNLS